RFVVETADCVCLRHLPGALALAIGIYVRLEPEPCGGKGKHAAKLAAAKNPNGASRGNGSGESLRAAHLLEGFSATDSVCFFRQPASRFASALSERARMAAACRAAFFAPLSPIAKVATGTPPGIWTIE